MHKTLTSVGRQKDIFEDLLNITRIGVCQTLNNNNLFCEVTDTWGFG